MTKQDLNLRTAAGTSIAIILGILPPDILSVINAEKALTKLMYGTNQDIKPIAQKTTERKTDEKPIYVLCYKDMGIPTHSAAFYDEERIDFYPKNVAEGNVGITDLINMTILNGKTENKFREESNDPGENNIECYAIYPSQLGISPTPTPEKIKEIIQEIKNTDDYQLYNNNCADQVIEIFKRLGINMDTTKGYPSLPSNVRNFASANGYLVPHKEIPFCNKEQKELKKKMMEAALNIQKNEAKDQERRYTNQETYSNTPDSCRFDAAKERAHLAALRSAQERAKQRYTKATNNNNRD